MLLEHFVLFLPVNPGSFHCSKTPTTHSSLRTLEGTLFLKKSKVCRMENIFSISGSDLSNGLTIKKIVSFMTDTQTYMLNASILHLKYQKSCKILPYCI